MRSGPERPHEPHGLDAHHRRSDHDPAASCAVALIDRLTHHAEIIPIEGESYRKREADLTQKQRRAAP